MSQSILLRQTCTSRVALKGSKKCRSVHLKAQNDTNSGSGAAINEDVLARLRAAEEEAARLRQKLAEAQGEQGAPANDVLETPSKRIDGGDLRRETLFTVDMERRNWLSEADVDFFTGSGISESGAASTSQATPEEQAIVQRRLIIGAVLAAATAAFSLVPTDALKPAPTKPLFFYLTPLVRIQGLLEECGPVIEDGDWVRLQQLLANIQGPPNNARNNLYDAASLLPEGKKAVAQKVALEVVEYLTDMNYNTFFDALPGQKNIPPAQQAKFVQFSSNAKRAAQGKLKEFLALMPQDQVEAAQQQATFSF